MPDLVKIESRLAEIRQRLVLLEKDFKPLAEEKLVQDENLYASAERHLEVAIQACLDIANHLVAVLNLARFQKKNSEVFAVLAHEKIITTDCAEIMAKIIGYRNILVHDYLVVDRHQTYLNIQLGLDDLVEFLRQIELYLKKF